MVPAEARLKRKITGVLIRYARTQVGLDVAETATLLGVDASTIERYELGQAEPSLPQLEAMTRIFQVSRDFFWSDAPFSAPDMAYEAEQSMRLRREEIGQRLRRARETAGLQPDALAQFLECSPDDVLAYEAGKTDIPLSQLQAVADHLQTPFAEFLGPEAASPESQSLTTTSPVPTMSAVAVAPALQHLDENTLAFLSDPANVLYIKLAMRLHGLSAENLRALAEGILDITY